MSAPLRNSTSGPQGHSAAGQTVRRRGQLTCHDGCQKFGFAFDVSLPVCVHVSATFTFWWFSLSMTGFDAHVSICVVRFINI